MRLFEAKKERQQALDFADKMITAAENANRHSTAEETKIIDGHLENVKKLNAEIEAIENSSNNTLRKALRELGPAALLGGGVQSDATEPRTLTPVEGKTRASQFRTQFAQFVNRSLAMVGGGLAPKMEASDPSGVISIGTGGGLDSVGVTVPTEILPYLPSYYNLDSFALAGATQIQTEHTRPLVKPILSAGAESSTFAENTAPSSSQPFGLSSFTFNGTKYSRLVLATYESLMNSELPLQGAILDELLSSLATTFTKAITTAMFDALAIGGSTPPLRVGVGSGSIYTSMIELRHAIPARFDNPTNKWMLSRATLATIRNTRASTSGVPMFDPTDAQIFGREYVVNDNFDSICGAGFVVYGNWAEGAFVRKTPVFTRVFQERYADSGEIGFRTTQFLDSHFLAELVDAAQPPTFQPLCYTSLAGES